MAKGIRESLGHTAFRTAADHLCHSTSVRQRSPGLLASPKINSMTEKKTWVSTNYVLSLSFPLRFPESQMGHPAKFALGPSPSISLATPVSCATQEGTWLVQTT